MKWRNIFLLLLIVYVVYLLFFAGGNVAVIKIEGEITPFEDNGILSSISTSSNRVIKQINAIKEDNSIKAVVFEINSPGGEVVASEEIVRAIKNLDKPKYALIRTMGASGAYWAASQTDYIIANPLSYVGSIGVLGSYIDFADFIEENNITYNRVVAGKYKDMYSPFKKLTDEEKSIMDKNVNIIYDYFVSSVAENRNKDIKYIEELATGEIFIGKDALDLGLVDALGSKEELKNIIKNQTQIENIEFYEYPSQEGFFGLGSLSSNININLIMSNDLLKKADSNIVYR